MLAGLIGVRVVATLRDVKHARRQATGDEFADQFEALAKCVTRDRRR